MFKKHRYKKKNFKAFLKFLLLKIHQFYIISADGGKNKQKSLCDILWPSREKHSKEHRKFTIRFHTIRQSSGKRIKMLRNFRFL
jgi:hypothetical protein